MVKEISTWQNKNGTNKLHSLKHGYLKQFFGRNLFLVGKQSIFGECGGHWATKKFV